MLGRLKGLISFEKVRKLLFFDNPEPSRKEKWILITKLLKFNALVVAILFLFSYHILDVRVTASNCETMCRSYFGPLKEFPDFFMGSMLKAPLVEEAMFRSLVWLVLLSSALSFIKNKYVLNCIIWFVIIAPTIYWVLSPWSGNGHKYYPWTVFAVGLSFGWLVGKTKSLWPAIIAHSTSNFLLYAVIHIVQHAHSLLPKV